MSIIILLYYVKYKFICNIIIFVTELPIQGAPADTQVRNKMRASTQAKVARMNTIRNSHQVHANSLHEKETKSKTHELNAKT